MQGLVVVPLFAGWDVATRRGPDLLLRRDRRPLRGARLLSVGSGSVFARGSLKKLYRPDFDASEAAMAVIQALYDAADDDSATGGPDMTRQDLPGGSGRDRGRRVSVSAMSRLPS